MAKVLDSGRTKCAPEDVKIPPHMLLPGLSKRNQLIYENLSLLTREISRWSCGTFRSSVSIIVVSIGLGSGTVEPKCLSMLMKNN